MRGHLTQSEELEAKLAAAEHERDEAWEWVQKLTKALTGLTVNGSEFFIRRGDRYIADIPACVQHVRDRDQRNHRMIVDATLRAKDAEAKLAALELGL